MLIFKFKDLINGIENLPKELLNYDSVVYRIHNIKTNQNYIGTAKYGMPSRLYDGFHGHVNQYKANNTFKMRGMYHEMNLNIDNFELIIEETANPEQYDWILQRETELIIQYDSVLFGYNVSPDGKPGWKENTFCVNDGTYDLYIYKKDIERFCQNGWKLGSCKHDFLKGTVWVNNGIIGKMINPDDLDKYLTKGFTLGNITSPNKGKTWVNDGVKSRLLNVEDLNNPEYKNYTNFGRIEYRQSSITKNTKTINNGIREIRISIDKIEDFLKDNLDYRLGKIKKKKK